MNTRIFVLATCIALCISILVSQSVTKGNNVSVHDLEVSIHVPKERYVKGEIVQLRLELVNNGDSTVMLAGEFTPENGVQLFISRDSKVFRRYTHLRWGRGPDRVSRPTALERNESLEASVSVLWNHVPTDANLDKLSEHQLVTDYAFPESGTYHIKAVYYTYINSLEATKIESAPVRITITDPVGADLRAWNLISERGDIGYFMQEGDVPFKTTRQKEDLVAYIGTIVDGYPESMITNQLKKSLEAYRLKEEKRQKR